MCNPLSIALSGVLIVGSFLARADSTHFVMLLPGVAILIYQLYTRFQFATTLPRVDRSGEHLTFLHRGKETVIEPSKIRTVIEKNFPYPDPWGRGTSGFPGIEIHLDGPESPLPLYFSYGMDRRRDEIFTLLTRWLDQINAYQSSTSKVPDRYDEEEGGD
jgi:hypothetical protein